MEQKQSRIVHLLPSLTDAAFLVLSRNEHLCVATHRRFNASGAKYVSQRHGHGEQM